MSVNFMWYVPNPTKEKCLSSGTSSNITPMENVFGAFPITLTISDLPILRAMHAATSDNFYQELSVLVEHHESICVRTQF